MIEELTDTRQQWKVKHKLKDILFIVLADEKSNEITAIPELLEKISIKGNAATIMGKKYSLKAKRYAMSLDPFVNLARALEI